MATTDTRVLIVVFDALRPEFVTPDLMPNLSAFAGRGVRYPNFRSTFPTETRVNQSAVVTGCYPARHGIVANKFPERDAAGGAVLNTGDDAALAGAMARAGTGLLEAPTLAERLAGAGLGYATISAGTPGGGRLINHRAETLGGFRFAMRHPEAAVPEGAFRALSARIGPLPGHARPATAWISYAVTAYLEHVVPEHDPEVTLLWLSEPDESFHHLGIGSPGSLQAIRHVDAELGRILAARRREIDGGRLQVIALSDHGQISLDGAPLDLPARLEAAGFDTRDRLDGAAGCIPVVDNAGGLWLARPDPDMTRRLIAWLSGQDWCGPLFTRDGTGGTLSQAEIGLDHRRAPDISLCLRASDAPNAWGVAGMTAHDAAYPVGGGCHGGLSRHELENVLAMGGGAFAEGRVAEVPAGNIDIAPTVLSLLGLEGGEDLDGRVLSESFATGGGQAEHPVSELLTSTNGEGPVTHLAVTTCAGARYLDRAWVE